MDREQITLDTRNLAKLLLKNVSIHKDGVIYLILSYTALYGCMVVPLSSYFLLATMQSVA